MPSRRVALAALALAVAGCAHAIKNVSDCDQVEVAQRIACGECVVRNKAGGFLGEFEYRPDNAQDQRCVQTKK
jgi:hypothetical protein